MPLTTVSTDNSIFYITSLNIQYLNKVIRIRNYLYSKFVFHSPFLTHLKQASVILECFVYLCATLPTCILPLICDIQGTCSISICHLCTGLSHQQVAVRQRHPALQADGGEVRVWQPVAPLTSGIKTIWEREGEKEGLSEA